MSWMPRTIEEPPENVVVMTAIIDARGVERNVQKLKRVGALWFLPDSSMYIYYEPTHWEKKEK